MIEMMAAAQYEVYAICSMDSAAHLSRQSGHSKGKESMTYRVVLILLATVRPSKPSVMAQAENMIRKNVRSLFCSIYVISLCHPTPWNGGLTMECIQSGPHFWSSP